MERRKAPPKADRSASTCMSGGSSSLTAVYGTGRETDIQKEMENARREAKGLPPRQVRERPQKPQMATDDQVYERYKKRARR